MPFPADGEMIVVLARQMVKHLPFTGNELPVRQDDASAPRHGPEKLNKLFLLSGNRFLPAEVAVIAPHRTDMERQREIRQSIRFRTAENPDFPHISPNCVICDKNASILLFSFLKYTLIVSLQPETSKVGGESSACPMK